MKKLILIAHPSITSTSHKIADIYKKKSENGGDNVRLHDLYKSDKQLGFLDFNKKEKHLKYREDELLRADELVFVLPLRHGERPAILKNWLDNVFHGGFSHQYKNGKPQGLLGPRTAKIFVTCGAPSIIFKLFPLRFKIAWGKMKLGFAGIKLKKVIYIDKIYSRKKKNNFQDWLDKKVK